MDDPRSQQEILAAISEAREDLSTSLADLKETVEAMNARPLLTPEEKEALEAQASSGELGEDMKTLVEKIRGGEDTWEQVFSGESPHGALLQGHLTRMVEEHQDASRSRSRSSSRKKRPRATSSSMTCRPPTDRGELQVCSSVEPLLRV